MKENVPEARSTWSSMRRVSVAFGLIFIWLLIIAWVKPETTLALLSSKHQVHQDPLPQGTSPADTGNPKENIDGRVDKLAASVKAETDVFAAQKEEIEYLTHLTEAMMTVAGVFALFLAGASWAALEGQRKAAQHELTAQSNGFARDSRSP